MAGNQNNSTAGGRGRVLGDTGRAGFAPGGLGWAGPGLGRESVVLSSARPTSKPGKRFEIVGHWSHGPTVWTMPKPLRDW